jgi:predicted alpha/beta hydrolase
MMQVPPGESLLAGSRTWPLIWSAAAIILLVSALLSIWMGRRHSRQAKVLWTVIVIVLPVLGPVGWFLLGREKGKKESGIRS